MGGPPPASGAPAPRRGVPPWAIPAAIVAVLAIVLVVIVASGGDDDENAADDGTGVTATTVAGNSPTGTAAPTTTFLVGPGEVLAEPANDIGPIPFTDPVADPDLPAVSTTVAPSTTTTLVADTTTSSDPSAPSTTVGGGGGTLPQAIPPVQGNVPGLYGGTNNDRVCDPEQMITFLEANPQKAAAWAGAQGIAVSEIATYIRTLTPVLLMSDTRLTNYGFQNGAATKRQVVLQAGTAVLVDRFGTPRARCLCGNPLGPPELNPGPTTTYTGKPWTGFSPTTIIVVVPADEPIDIIILRDPNTLVISVGRPVGTAGGSDVAPPPTTVVPTTAPPTTTATATTEAPPTTEVATTVPETTAAPTTLPETTVAPTTTAPPPASNIAAGSTKVDASTVYTKDPSQDFSPSKAFDGRYDTSWFSAGVEDRNCVHPFDSAKTCSLLAWENQTETDVFIESIGIVNNEQNPLLQTANKFGFNSVYVQVFDLVGTRTYPADPNADAAGVNFSLNGAGLDPNLDIPINVRGYRVLLLFEGHDDPTCGGISELEIYASPIIGIV